MIISLKLTKYQLFSAFGFFVIGLEALAIALALLGFFYWQIFAAFLFFGLVGLYALLFANREKFRKPTILLAGLITLIFVIFLVYSTEPSIYGGRDQGSFSEAAIRLSQNHQLTFETPASREFFKIYGPGTALNFPGFNYTSDGKLITQFSVGYVAWLAAFYSLFGLAGFAIANGLSFLLFSGSFFLLIRQFAKSKTAFWGLLFVLTSFLFSWLFRLTLSENFALGLVWFGILEFVWFSKTKQELCLLAAITAFLILSFTRIEAWAILAVLAAVLYLYRKRFDALQLLRTKLSAWILGIFLLLFVISLKVNSQFYLASLKGLLHSFLPNVDGISFFTTLSYLFGTLFVFNLLTVLLLGLLGIFYFIKTKKISTLLPFILTAPIFIYLIHPGVSIDSPWMLRRYAFAIIPAAIFYTVMLMDRITSKILFNLFALILVGTNLSITYHYINYTENKNLLPQIEKISTTFLPTDLVLVDQLATGSGWSMMAGPLDFVFGKQAVYFFNPKDLAKIDTKKFSRVYLIAPSGEPGNYAAFFSEHEAVPIKNYTIQRNYLDTPPIGETSTLPQKTETVTDGIIYLLKK